MARAVLLFAEAAPKTFLQPRQQAESVHADSLLTTVPSSKFKVPSERPQRQFQVS
jgi:hypothetical protein